MRLIYNMRRISVILIAFILGMVSMGKLTEVRFVLIVFISIMWLMLYDFAMERVYSKK